MTTLNVNIPDSDLDSLSGAEIKAHISAINGQPEKKIATRADGLKTLRRLRQWASNQDGLLGVPKDGKPVIRTYNELQARAAAKGKTLADLPKAFERVLPVDPEWEDESEIVDGNAAVEEANSDARFVGLDDSHNALDEAFNKVFDSPIVETDQAETMPVVEAPAEDEAGPVPTIPENPAYVPTARGVEVEVEGETIIHPRGTMRARLAQQAAEAPKIELLPSALKDRRAKKVTGEPRKVREMLLGVKATFAGTTKNHKGSTRNNVLVFIQTKANREIPGWPKGTVLPAEVDAHFMEQCKSFIHKLLMDGHLERVVPLVPGQTQQKKEVEESQSA